LTATLGNDAVIGFSTLFILCNFSTFRLTVMPDLNTIFLKKKKAKKRAKVSNIAFVVNLPTQILYFHYYEHFNMFFPTR
jgi:hypothetical protein